MKIFEKYTGDKTYMFLTGKVATPAVIAAEYPATQHFAHIVQTDESGEVLYGILNLATMRSLHGIDPALSEADAIAAIQEAENTVVEVVDEPTAEERIAAALEYQVMASLPDEEASV